MTTYNYTVAGTAADNQTWEITGTVEGTPGRFSATYGETMKAVFTGLTDGKAVYGNPGVGCVGPYFVTKMVIEAQPIA